MNYLIPLFDCVLFSGKFFELHANAKYQIELEKDEKVLVFSNDQSFQYLLDFNNSNENLLVVKHKFDLFYFLFKKNTQSSFLTSLSFNGKIINVSMFDKLMITIDGMIICEESVDNLTYSHCEIEKDYCYIYFSGKRDYMVVIKNNECVFSSYYDEVNIIGDEKFFMCKLFDSLNHGRVWHIKGKEVSNYLVYLDDEDLNLKSCFLPIVFLDCVLANNFSYCNNLLCDELKMQDKEQVKQFFPEFDFVYPINETNVVLANKNTLAGIYEFEIENCLIKNIRNH